MSDSEGPWGSRAPPLVDPRAIKRVALHRRVRWRPVLLIGLIGAVAAAVWLLSGVFPGRISGSDWIYPVQGLGWLTLVASGLLVARRYRWIDVVRNLALWTGVAAVLALGFSYRDDLWTLGLRLRSELIPGYALSSDAHTLVLTEQNGGGYQVIGRVNGVPVTFLVDTGASDIVLSPGDARRLGVDTDRLHYGDVSETANGPGYGAAVTVGRLSIGPIHLSDVRMSINRAPMHESLLGMAFLRRLESFEVRGRRMTLKWRP